MIKCPQCSIKQSNHVVCEICGYHFTAEDNIKAKNNRKKLIYLSTASVAVFFLVAFLYRGYKKNDADKAQLYTETKQTNGMIPSTSANAESSSGMNKREVQQSRAQNAAQNKSSRHEPSASSQAYRQAQMRQEKERRVYLAIEALKASYVPCNKQNLNMPKPQSTFEAGAQIAFSVSEQRRCEEKNRRILIEIDDLLASLEENGPQIVEERRKRREIQGIQEKVDRLERNADNLESKIRDNEYRRTMDRILNQ